MKLFSAQLDLALHLETKFQLKTNMVCYSCRHLNYISHFEIKPAF